jgi:hypothetical protein
LREAGEEEEEGGEEGEEVLKMKDENENEPNRQLPASGLPWDDSSTPSV